MRLTDKHLCIRSRLANCTSYFSKSKCLARGAQIMKFYYLFIIAEFIQNIQGLPLNIDDPVYRSVLGTSEF